MKGQPCLPIDTKYPFWHSQFKVVKFITPTVFADIKRGTTMNDNSKRCTRRDFFKTTGAAGVGVLITPLAAGAQIRPDSGNLKLITEQSRVPTRSFGNSGIQVSILSLGGMFDMISNQLMLRQALRWGVTYWDTADCYGGGSEAGIGKYFRKYPQDRKKVFLVTKSDARDPKGIAELLNRSLARLNTDYIDLYFIHGISSIDELGDDTRRWAEKAKAAGKIRLFGFSTHSNMEELLLKASQLGYIDGIMMTYNFRNMHTPEMKRAVAACVKAGIGLTAMKTQAERSWRSLSKGDTAQEKLMTAWEKRGFTEHQAKLKAVWTNPHIAAICSQMPNMTILKANVAAAVDTTPLSSQDMHLFEQYAHASAAQYCAGCGQICARAVDNKVPISDIMRYHMYGRSYGRLDWARDHFKALPARLKQQITQIDYTMAERHCPQKMPIARLMLEAVKNLA